MGFRDWLCEPTARDDDDGSEIPNGRLMYKMLLEALGIASVAWSGGTNTPSPRNDRTFDMRMREEAEGERRMMGS